MSSPVQAQSPIGVLVANLGTPDSPDVADVRRYLRQFLSDPKVVEVSPWLWRPLLEGFILPLRAGKSAELYQSVWTADGSPLLHHSRSQCDRLAERLGERFVVRLGMRYGSPSIGRAVEELCARGCERIVFFPLFPQYSSSTTGTAYAELYRCLAQRRVQPAIQVIPPYPTDPAYIEALAARMSEARGPIDHYVVSFHGLPQSYVDRGDPYLAHCRATARALQARLGIEDARWSLAFQSRFGRQPWLQPYADQLVPALARDRARVLVATPGFPADCLETLEEIGLRLCAAFRAAGGQELVVVPCLNEHPAWIDAMEAMVRRWSAADPG
jgi:ferrochelatase